MRTLCIFFCWNLTHVPNGFSVPTNHELALLATLAGFEDASMENRRSALTKLTALHDDNKYACALQHVLRCKAWSSFSVLLDDADGRLQSRVASHRQA